MCSPSGFLLSALCCSFHSAPDHESLLCIRLGSPVQHLLQVPEEKFPPVSWASEKSSIVKGKQNNVTISPTRPTKYLPLGKKMET